MPKEEPALTPKTGLLVPNAPVLSATQQTVLAELYLPLTGALAYGLYAALLSLQSTTTQVSGRHSHAEVLGILNADLPTVLAARTKLEGTGLLRTYYQPDELGDYYIYQLQPPMTAQQFFADDLLSVLLLDMVGETRYQQVAANFKPAVVDLSQAQEVTAGLLDVFHLDGQKVTTPPATVQQVRQTLPASEATTTGPDLTKTDFDWQVLGQILQQNYVDLKQVSASRELIVTESQVYGISEVEMGKLISEVASLTTGHFDENQLKLLIARRYQRPTTPVATPAAASAAAAPTSPAAVTTNQFSTSEQQLLSVVKSTAPSDFLTALKQEKHGIVTAGEQRLLYDLVQRRIFSNGVINMLTYCILQLQKREVSTLNKNLMETIADNWAQHEITTPEAALTYLKQREQAQNQPTRKRAPRRQNGRPVRKEVVPKWMQASASAITDKPASGQSSISAAQRQKLAERVAKLKSDKEG
ncbi:replication initiation and membrane attachment family protein [Lactiplantibacillus dongliensis]|uniref:Replication initiation and membrane attachment family protein n=1 Tax=Lactiplantibacillus dongliensis TaxID=2559919 RepID=A0ABW1R9H3_9LACO|nr:DnaD domain protein [Lactiplantibacillus dongliensis]